MKTTHCLILLSLLMGSLFTEQVFADAKTDFLDNAKELNDLATHYRERALAAQDHAKKASDQDAANKGKTPAPPPAKVKGSDEQGNDVQLTAEEWEKAEKKLRSQWSDTGVKAMKATDNARKASTGDGSASPLSEGAQKFIDGETAYNRSMVDQIKAQQKQRDNFSTTGEIAITGPDGKTSTLTVNDPATYKSLYDPATGTAPAAAFKDATLKGADGVVRNYDGIKTDSTGSPYHSFSEPKSSSNSMGYFDQDGRNNTDPGSFKSAPGQSPQTSGSSGLTDQLVSTTELQKSAAATNASKAASAPVSEFPIRPDISGIVALKTFKDSRQADAAGYFYCSSCGGWLHK